MILCRHKGVLRIKGVINMTIGERIAKRREELGYTQEELAKKMGYSGKSIISKTENKKNDIKLNTVSRFAKALDCTESF